jgi:hypothetical protein
MPENKYKMFRNFMVNELGISKDDIKDWCQSAVREEVAKLVGQIDVPGQVRRAVEHNIGNTAGGIREAVAREIAARLVITSKQQA